MIIFNKKHECNLKISKYLLNPRGHNDIFKTIQQNVPRIINTRIILAKPNKVSNLMSKNILKIIY